MTVLGNKIFMKLHLNLLFISINGTSQYQGSQTFLMLDQVYLHLGVC